MPNFDCFFRPGWNPSRRDVLRGMIATAGICALGPFGRDSSEALGAPRTNFKRLVVVNMVGGCDTLNMVVPVGLSSYYTARGGLAIPTGNALTLNGSSAYKLHPSMARIRDLWNTGDALAVQRVGYPTEDLSHFVSSDVMSYGVRGSFSPLHINPSGWIARYADRYAPSPLGAVSIGIGRPLDFIGGVTNPLSLSSLVGMNILAASANSDRIAATKTLVKNANTSGLTYEAQHAVTQAYELVDQVQQAAANHATYLQSAGIAWPNSAIAGYMKDVAGLIYGGFDTRIFYTGYGGFDTHGSQAITQQSLFAQLDGAIGAFSDEMKLLGVWDDVVIVVITEFGRRSYWNGSGTDHGHGFAEMVVGGAVNGGASYGPDLTNADLTNANGYLSYAVDFRSVYKEILRDHLGADPTPVFPEALQISNDLGLV